MQNEFARAEMLLGKAAMQKLGSSRVAVFGIGGVGGSAAEALARAGIGAIDLIDADVVNLTNINRQIVALHSTLGLKKAEVMRARILDINPRCAAAAYVGFYCPENADSFDLSSYDYIVDAIDTVSSKLLLIERAAAAGVPVISSMGAGNKLDPTRLEVADIYQTSVCPLARVMRRELKARGIPALKVVYSREEALVPSPEPDDDGADGVKRVADAPPVKRQTPGSVSFVPPAAGLILAAEAVKDILAKT
jgi:tRNA A37 threonylcarbamoyladenosine dehydratase